MKVAFLFVEAFPDYNFALQLINEIESEEVSDSYTYIRVGTWGLGSLPVTTEQKSAEVFRALYSEHGNTRQLKQPDKDTLLKLVTEEVTAVQFDSIRPGLARRLHHRLGKVKAYLGFTQVLPHLVPMHQRAFAFLPPVFHLEQGKLGVLFSGDDGNQDVGPIIALLI